MKKLPLVAAALAASLAFAGSASAEPHHPRGWHEPHHPVCHWETRHHHKVRVCR